MRTVHFSDTAFRHASPATPTSTSRKPESRTNKRLSVASLSDMKGSPRTPGTKAPLSRFATPDGSERLHDDADDTASVAGSIADSVTGKGSRKTEEERIEFIRSHRECREVEPHRAFCIPCDAWIPLNSSRRYSMQPWIVHIKACRSGKLRALQAYVPLTVPFMPSCSISTLRHHEAIRQVIHLLQYVLASSPCDAFLIYTLQAWHPKVS